MQPPVTFNLGPSRREILRSAAWAAAITAPLCIFGATSSMGLAHTGGPLLLLFALTFPVFMLFGSGGLFSPIPEWLFATLLVVAEYVGIFVVVLFARTWRKGGDA